MLNRLSPNVFLAALLTFFAVLPAFANNYLLYVGNMSSIYVILSVGLTIVLGQAGLLSFVNGALFGVGAYVCAALRTWFDIPYFLALPASAIAALIIGVLIALPALRLSGLYLAMATVAFAQTASWVFLHWDSGTGGATGIRVVPVNYPFGITADYGHYYLSLAAACLVVILSLGLKRSRIGRAFVAVRESEVGAESLAIDITRYKTLAYGIGALFAGFAGGLFAPLLGLVVPESYDISQVILQFAMVIVGGLGSIVGAVIGAIALVWMQEWLRAFKELQEIAFGGMILLTILFLPGGVAGLLQTWLPSWREAVSRKAVRR